jgi:arsenate reductase (glutaredoxin)
MRSTAAKAGTSAAWQKHDRFSASSLYFIHFIATQMKSITIYHNPQCGTSRNVLALIRNSGVEPEIIEYLKHPPGKAQLAQLVAATGHGVRALLREQGTPFAELGLHQPHWTDEELLDFMVAHPILMNRPVVVTPLGTRLCRPSETVLDLLPTPQQRAFTKEDGEQVVDATGNRLLP